MVLARAYSFFETQISGGLTKGSHQYRILLIALAGMALAVVVVQSWLFQQEIYDGYWLGFYKNLHGIEWWFIASCIISFLLMLFVLLLSLKKPFMSSWALRVVLILFLVVPIVDMYPVGVKQWTFHARRDADHVNFQASQRGVRRQFQIEKLMEYSWNVPRIRMEGTLGLPAFNVGYMGNWYFDRYLSFDHRVFSSIRDVKKPELLADYKWLMGMVDARRLFFSQEVDHSSINDFVLDVRQTEGRFPAGTEVKIDYNGDRFVIL